MKNSRSTRISASTPICSRFPIDVREERASRLLAASGMSQFRSRRAGQLSGGMKQKLGLTCALVHTPQILLLDEPTTGVDPVSRRDFWRILYGLREEGVTILITHRLSRRGGALQSPGASCTAAACFIATRRQRSKRRMPGAVVVISSAAGRRGAPRHRRA